MNFTYVIILAVVLVISPFVLKLASNQGKKTKQQLKSIFLLILSAQILLGFLNWENFTVGRSGFELSLTYPFSFLGLFFVISVFQILLLLISKSFNILVVVLNFINSILIFTGLIRISSLLDFQAVSFASIGTVFLVLIGNVIGLVFINKDKNILRKYAGQKGLTLIPLLVIAGLLVTAGIVYVKTRPMEEIVPEQVIDRISSTGMTKDRAIEIIKNRSEVQDYLKRVPNGRVEVDNEDQGEYNVHVYEIKDGHTATFNWYKVSIKSGEIRPELEINSTNTGTLLGKLCYPSEVLPPGKIEAKRLSDNQIFTQDYPGNQNGGKSNYAFELEEGDYYLRYRVADNLIGYSTTVCPTGQEETCGDTKMRVLRKVEIKPSGEISSYDLCDYYYNDSNAPKF